MTYFSNWIILYPIAFSLFLGLRLAAGSRDDSQRTTWSLVLRLIAFLFFLVAFLSIGLRASGLSIVWIAIMIVFSIVMVFKNRRLERSAVLYTLLNAQNHSQRQSIAETFFQNNRGYVRRRARALGWAFSNSIEWGASLERCRVAKSLFERLRVRLQVRYGLHDRVASDDTDHREPLVIEQELERTLGRLMVLSWVIFLLPVLTVIVTFILPTFKSMFNEFGIPLPPILRFVMLASDDFVRLGMSALLSFVPLLIISGLFAAVLLWIFPQISQLPIIRWAFRDYHRNLGFVALRNACEHEQNITQACYATAHLVPLHFLAERYQQAAELLNQGQLPSAAFQSAGVLTPREVASLALGLDSRDPTWGLRQLATWKTERMLRRISVLVQWLIVCVTLLSAVVVGAFAVGIIQALSMMILELN